MVELIQFLAVGLTTSLCVFVVRKLLFPPRYNRNKPLDEKDIIETHQNKIWSFVAMRYHSVILNRSFKVFVTDRYVCGVKSAGTIASPSGVFGDASSEWEDPNFYVDFEKEKKYKKGDFESKRFLQKDNANFLLVRSEIDRIDYHKTKWGMGLVPYSGRLVLVMKNGQKVELILLGKQDPGLISKRLLEKSI